MPALLFTPYLCIHDKDCYYILALHRIKNVPSDWKVAKTRDQKVDPSKVCSDATY